ncbi:MAG: hypothetical protein AAF387_09930, partial [Pseudomonadota bacterium]
MALSGAMVSNSLFAKEPPAISALDKSALIYLSPILSNGNESKCHGEVWFIHHENEIFVVTQQDAWRAEAVRQGLNTAACWIGEFGVWTRAKNKYKSAPYLRLSGRLETDAGLHSTLLEKFGVKYAKEWDSWGPRFRKGLANGSRVMLRYQPIS